MTVAIVCAVPLGATIATATPVRTGQPDGTKASAPMNLDPGKHPVTDPARLTIEPPVPIPADQAARDALAWEAREPNSRVACFADDGTVAGLAELDRVDPSRPITAAQRAELCARETPPPAASRGFRGSAGSRSSR
jgi:hypothetical protein